MNIYEKLSCIQTELKAPKNQYNSFGNYKYRSCEDILEAVKPLLVKHKCTLTLEDTIVHENERYYVKVVARLIDIERPFMEDDEISVMNCVISTAYAREEESKKGMDGSQITGASSSYARKYALNGLFLIDDMKDSDSTNTHEKQISKSTKKITSKASQKQIAFIENLSVDLAKLYEYYGIKSLEELTVEQASEIIKAKGGKK